MAIKWKSDSDLLEELKKSKSEEMSRICGERIVGGFEYILKNLTYHFSYDAEAQVNFQEAFRLFENDIIKNIIWSARLNGGKVRLPLIKEEFYQVYFASVKHKFDTISKYNDVLIPLINQAKTVEEVEAITWGCEPDVTGSVELIVDDTLENKVEKTKVAQAQGDMELLNLILMGGFG